LNYIVRTHKTYSYPPLRRVADEATTVIRPPSRDSYDPARLQRYARSQSIQRFGRAQHCGQAKCSYYTPNILPEASIAQCLALGYNDKNILNMKKPKIITICSSAAHFRNALEIEKQLKAMGYKIKIPKTANIMKRTNNFDISSYKTWYNNKHDYKKKTQLIKGHFKKVLEADAILVTNFEKNGLPGYIGGNVLMEMVLAFHYKKPIFIYNNISEDLNIKEEVYGLNPIFLKQDLNIIRKKL